MLAGRWRGRPAVKLLGCIFALTEAMRRILIDDARRRQAVVRRGKLLKERRMQCRRD